VQAKTISTETYEVRRHVVDGSLRILLAEALILPTGLVTAAFLTRHLGPTGYGLFTLASVVVLWIEWCVTSIFSRSTVKLIGDADDWRPWGATIVRFHLFAGLVAALLLWCLSSRLAAFMNEPELGSCLRLFAFDIPLFSLATAHRDILVGTGRYRQRAQVSAARWLIRLAFMLLLVGLGLSVKGAIWASISASVFDLAVARFYSRPPLFGSFALPLRQLWQYALPLFLSGLTLRLFEKLDLLTLKALGATAALAGIYGAAQNLTIVPGLVGLALAPVLLCALTRTLRAGEFPIAQALGRDAVRSVVCLLPFAAMVAGAAPAITTLILGSSTAILISADKPGSVLALSAPLVPLAMVAQLMVIPRVGAWGAAMVTTVFSVLLVGASLIAVYRTWRIAPSLVTLGKTSVISGFAYVAAAAWPATGTMLLIKLGATTLLIFAAFCIVGELGTAEVALIRGALRSQIPGSAEVCLPGFAPAREQSTKGSHVTAGN
jgi:O-antigen/teichoic acid export membrane protein